jgi:hypothetical protein
VAPINSVKSPAFEVTGYTRTSKICPITWASTAGTRIFHLHRWDRLMVYSFPYLTAKVQTNMLLTYRREASLSVCLTLQLRKPL